MRNFLTRGFNPLPDDKILVLPKLKAFADDKSSVTQNITVVFHRIKNTVGKVENAGYQHFLLFPQCFQKPFSPVCQKSSLCGNGLKHYGKRRKCWLPTFPYVPTKLSEVLCVGYVVKLNHVKR